MPRITRDNIKVNQRYLKRWDKYQLEWLNSDAFKSGSKKPLLLPITVDIRGGVMRRSRIKVPQLQTILAQTDLMNTNADVKAAFDSYFEFFEPQDGSQSGTPPETPLDFNINCPVIHLFYLDRDNWEFTDHTQFSVDNVPAECVDKDLFDVLDVFDDNRAMLVMNHNWTPDAANPEDRKNYMKYNLHVSIYQDVKAFDEDDNVEVREVRTDIIIDPGGNSNQGTTGGGPGGGTGEGPGGG